MSFKIDLAGISSQVLNQVNAELPARAASASQSLRNASLEILRGQRGGRTYRKPGGGVYTASAPGAARRSKRQTARQLAACAVWRKPPKPGH